MIDFASIRERVDLVELAASHGVELRRSGHEHAGLCPFHGEKAPSFFVNGEKGVFNCFGCGAKGDAIDFIRLVDGVTFEEAVERLSGEGLGQPRRKPTSSPDTRREAPVRNAAALWTRLALHDDAGEAYLAGRGLLYRDPAVMRFNVGGSGDAWLDARATEGYRCAFGVRRSDGVVQTISLRYALPGDPPGGKKTLALAGCHTGSAAICSPVIEQLAGGDPEFAADRILVCEGGTSWLGATALFSQAAADLGALPTWPLGVIGVSQAAGVVTAFANVVRWRTVLVGLDADEPGRAVAPAVEEAARKTGARDVLRVEVPMGAKDWAELARMEYAHA